LADHAVEHAAFCAECLGQIQFHTGATCERCAAKVPAVVAGKDRCYLCRGTKLWFDEAVALATYDGLLRDWLLEMKRHHGDRRSLALADLMWENCGERIAATRPDVVMPVPMHWRRRLVRGTNSPGLVAEVLAGRLRVPLAAGMVRRTRNTPPQSGVPPSERPGNVRGAFSVRRGYHLEAARVLVVDDILTTGSTCSAIARVLKRSGATHVAVAVIGRAGTR
jgi:ComF family protein